MNDSDFVTNDSDFITMHAWLRYNRARYERLTRHAELEAAESGILAARRALGLQFGPGVLAERRVQTLEWSSQR